MDEWAAARTFPQVAQSLGVMFRALSVNKRIDQERLGPDISPRHGQRALFVDVSELYLRDARTGIQRVVRNILRALQLDPPAGFSIFPVRATPGDPWRHTRKFDLVEHRSDAPPEGALVLGGTGDIFLGLDLSAHLFPANERFIEDLRESGVSFHFVVYDIIPLSHPHFADAGLVSAFRVWIDGLFRLADALHCISESVAEDVRGWFASHHPETVWPHVASFHLGADFSKEDGAGELSKSAPAAVDLPRGIKFLMVGTLEPRKGHAFVLDGFELLWSLEIDVNLVVVGKPGWMVDELIARIRNHEEMGRRLMWFDSADDDQLSSIYAQCDCLIAASEVEGFGLPLIEAAYHGLPILARDIRVFREVAGENASYFSGRDPEELFNAVCIWLERREGGETVVSRDMIWLTWDACARQLTSSVIDA
jgi:glycosyltransferase involved in cell wall biosynthesis